MARTQIDTSLLFPFASTFIGLGRNRMINGDFVFDQVNEGNTYTINTGSFQHAMDMTSAISQGTGVWTLARGFSSPPTYFTRYASAVCTTADAAIAASDLYVLRMKTEGYQLRDFSLGNSTARTFTVSFWVRSSLTGIYCLALQNNAGNRSYIAEYTINSANTWEYKTITVTGDTTGTWENSSLTGISVVWTLAVGSSNQTAPNVWTSGGFYGTSNQVNWMSSNTSRTFDLTGVQLELGSRATTFETQPYAVELALCQRYYEKSYSIGTTVGTSTLTSRVLISGSSDSASDSYVPISFKVVKRAAPTVTAISNAGSNANWTYARNGATGDSPAAAFDIGDSYASIGLTNVGAAWVVVTFNGHWTADARL